MKALISRIFRGTTAPIFLIRLLNTLAVTFILIYYSRKLSVFQYGEYITFWTTLTLVISVGSIGLAAALYNFSLRGWLSFYSRLSLSARGLYFLIAGTAAGLGLLYLNHSIQGLSQLSLALMCAVLLLSTFSFILDNVLIVIEKKYAQLAVSLGYSILLCSLHVVISERGFDWNLLLRYYAVIAAVKCGVQYTLFRTALRQAPLSPSYALLPDTRPSKANWWQMSIYEVFQFVIRYIDRFIITVIATKEMAAQYFNGRQEIPFLSALYSSFGHGLMIQLSKQVNADNKLISAEMIKVLKKTGSIVIGLFMFCWVYSEEIFRTVFTDKYLDAVPVFRLSLLLLPAQYLVVVTYIFQYKDQSKIINTGAYIDAGLSLLLLFPLYHFFQAKGIIIALLTGTYIQSAYYLLKMSVLVERPILHLIPVRYYLSVCLLYLLAACGSYYLAGIYTTLPLFWTGVAAGSLTTGITFIKQLKMK